MATGKLNLPPGFELEEPENSTPNLPPGFELEAMPSGDSSFLEDAKDFGRGLAQGASLGFADEIVGGAGAAKRALFDETEKPIEDLYREERDQSRAAFKAARERSPGLYTTGEVGGAVGTAFIPGLQGASIPKLAALGATQALGASEADTMGQMATDVAKGTATGAAFGGAGKLVPLAQRGLNKFAGALENAGDTAMQRALGFTKRFLKNPKMQSTAKDAVQLARERDIVKLTSSPEDIQNSINEILDQSGADIGAFTKGRWGFNPDDAVEKLEALRPRNVAGHPLQGGNNTKINQQIDKKIEEVMGYVNAQKIANAEPSGQLRLNNPMSFDDAQQLKGSFQDQANFLTNKEAGKLDRQAAGIVRGSIDDQLERISGDVGDLAGFEKFKKAKKDYTTASRMQDAISNRLSSESGNMPFGLTETISGAGALAKGDVGGALTTMGIVKAVKDKGSQATAIYLPKVANVLRSNPEKLGRFGQTLQTAAQRGGESLAIQDYLLQKTEPEYSKLIQDLENQDSFE